MRDSETILFITGGAYQGKLNYALSLCAPHPIAVIEGDAIPETWLLSSHEIHCRGDIGVVRVVSSEGEEAGSISELVVFDTVIVHHVERMAVTMRTLSVTPEEALENLLAHINQLNRVKQIILIADEVGSGIVPLGKEARLDRDNAGELAVACASKSSQVVHVLAGIPLVIR